MGNASLALRKEKSVGKEVHVLYYSELCVRIQPNQWPIVYREEYNISAWGLENLHVFDSTKWRNIKNFLVDGKMLKVEQIVTPKECTAADLLVVHTQSYLNSLRYSINVAKISEVAAVALLPNFIVQRKMLTPFRYQTGGTILAGDLAIQRGWAVNIGGGFHHCCSSQGGGFCAYADITLLMKFMSYRKPEISKILVIDLDAHQGNGYARDCVEIPNVHILDIYNCQIYPNDITAKRRINTKVEITCGMRDREYLDLVKQNVNKVVTTFKPEFIIYNAGTDILTGDPLGGLDVTGPGIITRDEIVFNMARSNNIPIVMLTSGGYLRSTARIIADSLINLKLKNLISGPTMNNP